MSAEGVSGADSLALELMRRTDRLVASAASALRLQTQSAAAAIAVLMRKEQAAAAVVLLDESDQGDWLTVAGWKDQEGVTYAEDFVGSAIEMDLVRMASCMYGPYLAGVCGLVRSAERQGYDLDIDVVVDTYRMLAS